MSMTLSVSEARATMSEVIERVLAGEEVTITRHGVAVAIVLRPDVFRARRLTPAMRMAQELHDRLERARHEPLDHATGLTMAEADDLVAEVEASRSAR
jgi:antitoxin (DNA-binding transcriptional repressor) of toxin-antitoxin stability system